jgi:hypothetical protein
MQTCQLNELSCILLPSTLDALEFTVMYVFPADAPVRKHVPSDEACHHYWTEKATTVKFYPTHRMLTLS